MSRRRPGVRVAARAARAVVGAACLLAGCQAASPPPAEVIAVSRPVGAWEGAGNSTIGFLSESGRFRVSWETRREAAPGAGTFRLAVHSGVSGRPIQLIADHRGTGGGSVQVDDDPRLYNLMVESAGIEWSVAVEEVVAGYSTGTPEGR